MSVLLCGHTKRRFSVNTTSSCWQNFFAGLNTLVKWKMKKGESKVLFANDKLTCVNLSGLSKLPNRIFSEVTYVELWQ